MSEESEFSRESDDRRKFWFGLLNAAVRELRPSLRVNEAGFLLNWFGREPRKHAAPAGERPQKLADAGDEAEGSHASGDA
jgi:hypothetical protein